MVLILDKFSQQVVLEFDSPEKWFQNLEIKDEGLDAFGGDKAFQNKMSDVERKMIMDRAYNAIILNLGDWVLWEVSNEKTIVGV